MQASHTITNPQLSRLVQRNKLKYYLKKASDAMLHWQSMAFRRYMEKGHYAYEKLFKETQEQIAQQVALAEERAKTHEAQITTRIKQMDQTHEQTIGILNVRIDAEVAQRKQTDGFLAQEKAARQQLETEAYHLRAAYATKVAECNALAQENRNKGGGGCTIL